MVTKEVDVSISGNICIWLAMALIQKKVFSLIRDYDFREYFSPTAGLDTHLQHLTILFYKYSSLCPVLNIREGKGKCHPDRLKKTS